MSKKVVLFVGSRDHELLEQVREKFNNENIVVSVLDRAEMNHVEDNVKKRVVDWKEKESISEYIRNPDNIKAAIDKGFQLYGMIKEMKAMERFTQIMEEGGFDDPTKLPDIQIQAIKDEANNHWNGWFVLKDVVEASTLSYSQARELLDSLYVFGFLAFREVGHRLYTLLLNDQMTKDYLSLLIEENKTNIKQLQSALKNIETRNKPVKKSRAKKEVAATAPDELLNKSTH